MGLLQMKHTPWEGAMRNIAAIWSPLIKKPQRVTNQMMHISDWLLTFFSAAGLDSSSITDIDGKDMWKMISEGEKSPRDDLIYNIDDGGGYAAVRKGDWKYVQGTTQKGRSDKWFGSSGNEGPGLYNEALVMRSPVNVALTGFGTAVQISEKKSGNNQTYELLKEDRMRSLREAATLVCTSKPPIPCNPLESPCLFNLKEDPCEMVNLADTNPSMLIALRDMLNDAKLTQVAPLNVPRDPNADPARWNNTWTNWGDMEDVKKQKIDYYGNLTPLAIILLALSSVAFLVVVFILVGITVKRSPKKTGSLAVVTEEDCRPPGSEMKLMFADAVYEDRETNCRSKDSNKSID